MNEVSKSTALTPVNNIAMDDDDDDLGAVKFAAFDAATPSLWFFRKGAPLPKNSWIVAGLRQEIIEWGADKKIVQRIVKTPGIPFEKTADELNAEVPRDLWPENPYGDPKGPFVLTFVILMLHLETGTRIIFSNSTFGHKQCYADIRGAIKSTRKWRGPNVVPVVELSSTPMPTRYGTKSRPHLEVKDWITPSGPATPIAPAVEAERALVTAVTKPTASEIVNDRLPDDPAPKDDWKAPWDDGFPENL
jgi:hypothetical protein